MYVNVCAYYTATWAAGWTSVHLLDWLAATVVASVWQHLPSRRNLSDNPICTATVLSIVQTNVNYVVVATFINQSEDSGSIAEAMQMIR